MKKILGLDLGTNSIGWALIEQTFEEKTGKIIGIGTRIIPMSQDILGDFEKGNTISQTAQRTKYRSIRRLRARKLLRRERLHRILNILNLLPDHYSNQIDFENHYGKYKVDTEPKIAYKPNVESNTSKGKFEFIFQKSFNEMLDEFKLFQPQFFHSKKRNGEQKKIPYDWTLYYLRKKALTQKIEKEELAWIILNFNQKRGYYQMRGEEEETSSNTKEYVKLLKVIKIEKGETDKKNANKSWYSVTLENGWVYSATFYSTPQWLNTEKEFLITEELDDLGNIKFIKEDKHNKAGREKRKITPLPSFEEIETMSKAEQDKFYRKIKIKTENAISNSGKTVGSYIYETLLNKPEQKIRGKLIGTIERHFYKKEIVAILRKQIELQPDLFTDEKFTKCITELYRNNEPHQAVLNKKDFIHLIVEDVTFYQRPPKSKKSTIGNCTLEFRTFKDKSGTEIKEYLKVIPKSHPLYQEFRIWQFIYDLRIYSKKDDQDVTMALLKKLENYESLFEFLITQKDVNHRDLLKHIFRPIIEAKHPEEKSKFINEELEKEIAKYRWNYVFDDSKEKEDEKSKRYPCNETGFEIRKHLQQVKEVPLTFLTQGIERQLWHIIYSVSDRNEYKKALKSFAIRHKLNETSFVQIFIKFPPFKREYSTYSYKALVKILSLMRIGKYWKWDAIDINTKNRINKIITGEFDTSIKERIREKAIHLNEENDFQGLQQWLAKYIIYDRHSEAEISGKWNSVSDLEQYIKEFKQHCLRNPIVEQLITETLRVVKEIWIKFGNGEGNYFNEIHIELGREMKNSAKSRKNIMDKISENEKTNLRIKALLLELKENSDGKLKVENVRPYSPIHQETLKIYEDAILNSDKNIPEQIIKISKTALPTKSELTTYKLWLEQEYRSPYTGQIIPLGKLFTPAYQIEHIIPVSRYFDDSLSNKVICESEVNLLKDNQLGLEFIRNHYGQVVLTKAGQSIKILSESSYREFINQHYARNASKRNKLLLENIPDKMIERQMNDTRYISKFTSFVLSNLVRSAVNDDGINSKNLIQCNGKITERLRHDWGLNNIWNELILPRFERMNKLKNSVDFTAMNAEGHVIPSIPFELSKGFQKKRIDHRHHAMDALVIACATKDHVNLLNNEHAKSDNKRYDLQRKLRNFKYSVYTNSNGIQIKRNVPDDFKKPWSTFPADAKSALERIVISFKQNIRVINKATNHFVKYKNGEKVEIKQDGTNWAIRKALHKQFVFGKIQLNKIKIPDGKVAVAIRRNLSSAIDLEKITDSGIQKILRQFLTNKNNNPELAFSPEGIEELNNNIQLYNNGKTHKPIYKIRTYEIGSRFPLGIVGNKKHKYVETADGTNLFFAIYRDRNGNRNFETIPLNIIIERQKQGLPSVPEYNEKGDTLLFYLSPYDIVFIPTEDEIENIKGINFNNLNTNQIKRIFVVNDFSGNTCYFFPNHLAKNIAPKEVDLNFDAKKNKLKGSFDTKTASFYGKQIKEICIKLSINRIGDITPAF